MADTGNPYKATPIFEGKYQLTLASNVAMANEYVMLAKNNQVMFMSAMSITDHTSDQVLATLPDECRPSVVVRLPVYLNTVATLLNIHPNGQIKLNTSNTGTFTGTRSLWLNGISFSINDRYY